MNCTVYAYLLYFTFSLSFATLFGGIKIQCKLTSIKEDLRKSAIDFSILR
jgi:hypothetical protein